MPWNKKHIPNLVFLLIHIYITNMLDRDYLSKKISQIKAIAYHKIKDGVLETIPYTNVLLNEKPGIEFKHILVLHGTREMSSIQFM